MPIEIKIKLNTFLFQKRRTKTQSNSNQSKTYLNYNNKVSNVWDHSFWAPPRGLGHYLGKGKVGIPQRCFPECTNHSMADPVYLFVYTLQVLCIFAIVHIFPKVAFLEIFFGSNSLVCFFPRSYSVSLCLFCLILFYYYDYYLDAYMHCK